MIFKPENSKLWDTFIIHHEGTFYLFYLQFRKSAWDGYGLAVSEDLIHWEDRGTILTPEPGEGGMGTGMVWRVKDRWMLNYSLYGAADGLFAGQQIYFAESEDLLTWRKLPKDIMSAPDPRWYECSGGQVSCGARWDSIWVTQQPDGTFLGFVTANAKEPAGANGVAGLVSSVDGIHWKTEPPASEPCGMVWAEFGGYVQFGARHYLLVGSSSGGGPRFDPVYNSSGKAGGMYVMMADNVRGPYRFVPGDPMLLGCRNAPPNWAYIPTYFARTCQLNNQTLLYHHWMPRNNFLDAWLGTVKLLEEEAPGKLVLKWWPGNENLKGTKLFEVGDKPDLVTPSPQAVPSGKWECAGGVIRGKTAGASLAFFETDACYNDGMVIESEFRISGNGAAGLFIGTREHGAEKPYEGVGCLLNMRGLFEFGRITGGIGGPAFMAENHVDWPIATCTFIKLTILVRGEFVEVYADGRLVQCYGFSKPAARNIGVFAERCEVEVRGLRMFKFNVPAIKRKIPPVEGTVRLPQGWQVFSYFEKGATPRIAGILRSIPEYLKAGDRRIKPAGMTAYDGNLDFAEIWGEVVERREAYIYIPFTVEQDGPQSFGFGADWWFQSWIDGESLCDTLSSGNGGAGVSMTDHVATTELKKGDHLLAVRFISGRASSRIAIGGAQDIRGLPS
ncbi:MAG: hypothetical protein L6437_10245 [Kiritimatiellae bacterium]|nr:hypothetical protein [Verrucomicrobiota bacterium]MCG2660611.1 hypothetical protein [Kiritimatiellia bacterium]